MYLASISNIDIRLECKDSLGPWHLQHEVLVIRNSHELGERRLTKYGMVYRAMAMLIVAVMVIFFTVIIGIVTLLPL